MLAELAGALGFADAHLSHFVVILVRLTFATALGALIAYRPWRRFLSPGARTRPETAQAQTLIAAVGAVMIAVIGDSTARAFGLVGLGGFLRFRSAIKDTRDAASMFIMIGIGMACGLGLIPMALVATAFFAVLIAIFDRVTAERPKRTRIGLTLEAPRTAMETIRAVLGARILEAPSDGTGQLLLECDAAAASDAGAVLEALEASGVTGIRSVKVAEE